MMIERPEIYTPKYFEIHELVPPEIFEKSNPKRYWRLFKPELLYTIDMIKEFLEDYYDKKITMTVNNYFWGGEYSQSGIRTPNSEYYSLTSQHTIGNAVDLKFKGCTNEDVYNLILEDPTNEAFKYITAIEDINKTPTWLHIDFRQWEKSKYGILIV